MHTTEKNIWYACFQLRKNKITLCLLAPALDMPQVHVIFLVYLESCSLNFCVVCWFPILKQFQSIGKVLPAILKLRKNTMVLMKKTCMLNQTCSGMSYSAIGCELRNTKYGIIKQTHTAGGYALIDWQKTWPQGWRKLT